MLEAIQGTGEGGGEVGLPSAVDVSLLVDVATCSEVVSVTLGEVTVGDVCLCGEGEHLFMLGYTMLISAREMIGVGGFQMGVGKNNGQRVFLVSIAG